MTNEEALTKALKKAGYPDDFLNPLFKNNNIYCRGIIFSHDFAKAFWGNKNIEWCPIHEEMILVPAWQYHLRQMVLEENPIDYLAKFLSGEEPST